MDGFSVVFRWVSIGLLAVIVLMVQSASDVGGDLTGEYLGLLFFSAVGLMLMAESDHLIMVYLSIELVSLSSYAMASLSRKARSSEAALKYLLFGALSSGMMLFGMSFIYGLTGELSFASLKGSVSVIAPDMKAALVISMVFVLSGIAFKISMFPFHLWMPDVFEGAPIPVAAFLSVGPKAAGLALLFRMASSILVLKNELIGLLIALTVVTMTFGNIVALVQSNIKRLLAYSTIAQAGYLLVGFVVLTPLGLGAFVIYLIVYMFMNLGAFACVVAVARSAKEESLESFRGLAGRSPVLSLCLSIFLISLAGIPPLAGFFGKFMLFGAAIESGVVFLAIAAAINSAISLYYYVNIIRLMYFEGADHSRTKVFVSLPVRIAISICLLLTVVLGIWPGFILSLLGVSSLGALI
jgi:proton-translocating NADH-quinone oxidoreductase chain N